jgi:hypothetical protein
LVLNDMKKIKKALRRKIPVAVSDTQAIMVEEDWYYPAAFLVDLLLNRAELVVLRGYKLQGQPIEVRPETATVVEFVNAPNGEQRFANLVAATGGEPTEITAEAALTFAVESGWLEGEPEE